MLKFSHDFPGNIKTKKLQWYCSCSYTYNNEFKTLKNIHISRRVVSGIFPENISGTISRNISTEINNRFPEIFPSGNFWEFFKNFSEISKNSFIPLKIDIEFLNS